MSSHNHKFQDRHRTHLIALSTGDWRRIRGYPSGLGLTWLRERSIRGDKNNDVLFWLSPKYCNGCIGRRYRGHCMGGYPPSGRKYPPVSTNTKLSWRSQVLFRRRDEGLPVTAWNCHLLKVSAPCPRPTLLGQMILWIKSCHWWWSNYSELQVVGSIHTPGPMNFVMDCIIRWFRGCWS